ncbi:MAG: macrolide transporter [SAR86 cluster bacterium BACL1 MAG-121105-bin34]|jgi:HlyD family secretion protein|uniref:Macrolide transporter n=1 Tax=SAR86 cluster bacterium BACL1 MAG-120820-bin45 TaxID=1655612 RepID=A0A0R2UEL1_9GAMM|nr:MAG: macrolide transporter [SAR86 cluster bacterium BACL1 MAG-120507-bin14]KRO95501.1 MAG: macrolide transporter [SAR86 cluster bacterium BACL1 MAG-120820-bin45]KRP01464.1 MAG: macrolide transporter [SAR86 cluster bacterium BACL1 MAG-120619-bin26]KRP12387.1 MAG: macrolide transporter [SAR86 cluster bacterium BACL1 MAG-121105-bin34]KRP15172.1 MAG: macrolide transporter [SAR86 cluster bacterium BACL1 MAG-121128-bin56]KRP15554.1 MAG: macrolide transporter [SAR86 cluster bacterium BACL1 MAG-121
MNQFLIKSFTIVLSIIFLASCGGDKKEEEFKFYTLKEAGAQQLELTVEASGTVEAISSIEIKSKASGQVLFLGAEIGDFVEKGIVLARIDQRTPTNTLAQANADLEVAKVRLTNAKNQFNRSKRLHDEGNISDKAFEDVQEASSSAQAQLVRAEVFLENARIALDDTSVRSPIAGTVISRLAEVGQVITSPTSAVGGGTLLMEMADLNKVRVRALIDEIDIGKISIGQEATLKVSAYRDKRFTGVVSKIEPMSQVDQNVTTFPVLIDIENKDNLLLIGMNTDVEIEILNEEVALALPAGSLRTRKDIASVAPLLGITKKDLNNFLTEKVAGENFNTFIVLKQTKKGAIPAWIKVGKTDLNHVEVKSGIDQKEIVYVLPSEGLIKYQQKFSERLKGRFG